MSFGCIYQTESRGLCVKSNWIYILFGVPEGSNLGPLLFFLFINDIVEDFSSCIRLFADDTTLYKLVENLATAAQPLNVDIHKTMGWARNG